MDRSLETMIGRAAGALRAAGASEVYVFGSAAQGTAHEDSDIDLAVSGLPPRQFFPALAEAQGQVDRPLDLVDLDEPTPFVRYLRQEGELRRVA